MPDKLRSSPHCSDHNDQLTDQRKSASTRFFDRRLHRAADSYWLAHLERQLSKGGFDVSYSQIGDTAGIVWETLSKQGPLTFAALTEEVNAPQSIFFMAIGWLSREDKV
jgi:winged helix-turn-helix protein DUF2582